MTKKPASRPSNDQKQSHARLSPGGDAQAELHCLLDEMSLGFFHTAIDGRIIYANPALASILGYDTVEELYSLKDIGKDVYIDPGQQRKIVKQALATGKTVLSEILCRRKDGLTLNILVNVKVVRDPQGNPIFLEGYFEDITARRQLEIEQNVTIELLRLINASGDLRSLVEHVTALLHDNLGCEAVGIRLRDGDDYPYYVTAGFPVSFTEQERSLCERFPDGSINRDLSGNSVFECLCGAIIRGRFDPAKPFYTVNGSFWTNSTTEFTASTAGHDRPARTRNRCMNAGYESVALVPLRAGGEALGLVQFNDHRTGMFTPGTIRFFEKLAETLAAGLARKYTEEALRSSEERFHAAFMSSPDAINITRISDGVYVNVNDGFCTSTGYTRDEVIGKSSLEINIWNDPRDRERLVEGLKKNGYLENLAAVFRMKSGELRNGLISTRLFTINGHFHTLSVVRDITDLKKKEEQLARQAMVLNQIGDFVTVTDLDGHIIYVNDAESVATGRPVEELLGKPITIFGENPAHGATQQEILEKTLEDGEWYGTVANISADGRDIILDCRTRLLYDDQGKPVAMFGVSTDITERIQAEMALAERERQLATLMSNLPGMAYRCRNDRDWTMLFVSEGAFALTGYRPEELVNNNRIAYASLVHPDDTELVWSTIQRAVEHTGPYVLEYRIIDASGKEKWVWEKGLPVREGDGKRLILEGFIADITEQKRVERALRENLAFQKTLLDTMPAPVYYKDTKGNYMGFNTAFARFFGQNQDELVGKTVYDIADKKLADIYRIHDVTLLEKPRDQVYESILVDSASIEHNVIFHKATFNNAKGDVAGIVGVILDITDIRKTERSLELRLKYERAAVDCTRLLVEESEEHEQIHHVLDILREAVNASRAYIFRNEMDESQGLCMSQTYESVAGGIEPQIDNQLLKHLPYSTGAPSLLPLLQARKPYTGLVAEISEPERSIMREQGILSFLMLPVFSGSSLWGFIGFDDCVTPRKWHEEDIDLLLAVADSIGAALLRKKVEEERTRLEDQLVQAQKMEAVGQLAGGIAHDFNNLLQVMQGYLDLIQIEHGSETVFSGELGEIRKAADRAADLTRQLLAFSRRQVMQPVSLNLNDVIAGVLQMIRRIIGEHIDLKFLPGEHLGIINADKGQIEQVLLNLCVNARDAMPRGGSLTIETENVVVGEEYRQDHPWVIEGRYVLLSVTDTGCGMDETTRLRVFEPFFTTKEIGAGTGLGLSMVYGIIRQHDGMITVYSEEGMGSTFKIYLPIIERQAETVGTKIEPRATGGTETILVAEDDPSLLRMVERILADAGYTVLTSRNGEEAIRVYENNAGAVDLVLLDVMMPKMGGRSVMQYLQDKWPTTKFLFTSGYSENAIHTNFVIHEGLRLIKKPYRRTDLLRAIRATLSDRG
jgi:PAS domain S-box-containing protein